MASSRIVEYRQVVDDRFNPFTESDQATSISNERQVIPTTSPFQVQLLEVPRQESPSSVTIAGFTEVSGTPAAGEFRVDYKYRTGLLDFNAADAGAAIAVTYMGTGTPVAAYIINELLDRSGVAAGAWVGHDWADHFTSPATPALTEVASLSYASATGSIPLVMVYRGGTTPMWNVQRLADFGQAPIFARPHQVQFILASTDAKHGGLYVNQEVYTSDVPVMFEWRSAVTIDSIQTGYAWGLAGRATVVASESYPHSAVCNKAIVVQTNLGSPGYVKFITSDSIATTTTDSITVTDSRSWNTYRIEASPSQVRLLIANTFGVMIERAKHTTNLPSSGSALVFGLLACERGNSGTAGTHLFDSARRVTLGNSTAP